MAANPGIGNGMFGTVFGLPTGMPANAGASADLVTTNGSGGTLVLAGATVINNGALLNFNGIGSPPVVTERNFDHTVEYVEGSEPIFIDGPSSATETAIEVSDSDAPAGPAQLNKAVIQITGGLLAGDALSVDVTGTNIAVAGLGTDTLTLTGADTIAN